jgi:hypothetical protein
MVRPADAAAPGEGVLAEGAGLLVLPQCGQVDGKVVRRPQRVAVILTQGQAAGQEELLVQLPPTCVLASGSFTAVASVAADPIEQQ